MKLWRCEICGDPYLGESKPSNCPFCGAPSRYLTAQKKYGDQTGPVDNLSKESEKNLNATLNLEINATKIYLCAAKCSANDEIKNIFKAFAKHENEHVSLVSKALGITRPQIDLDETICEKNDAENMQKTIFLEENAMKLYGKFLFEAKEPRVQQIFTALIDVESAHLKLSSMKLSL